MQAAVITEGLSGSLIAYSGYCHMPVLVRA